MHTPLFALRRGARRLALVALVTFIGLVPAVPARAASVLTDWLEPAVRAAADVASEPTAGSRFFAVLFTSTYDAWAAYDARAVGVASGSTLRGTGGAPTVVNEREAVSFAAYTALVALAPTHRRFFDAFMAEQGYDPASTSAPAVLGRRAAEAVLATRSVDGSNQSGSYSDVSAYTPAAEADGRWQPLPVQGFAQPPTTPHWASVPPFGLRSASQFRPPPPPPPGTPAFRAQVEELLAVSAALTDEQKAIAEYWAPFGAPPACHLMELTEWVSLRDDLSLAADVALFFIVSNAVFDAGVATWEAKYYYDYTRPVTAVRALGERAVRAWRPPARRTQNHLPNQGAALGFGDAAYRATATETMPAAEWESYLPTPPFPEYVSGHSAFTAAWAEAVRLATGNDRFGFEAEWPTLFVEGRRLDTPVVLRYRTLWDAAAASGASRLYGGVHWQVGNEAGLALGRAVAAESWSTAQMYLSGQASPLAAAATFLAAGSWRAETAGAARAVATDGAAGGLTLAFDGPGTGRWATGRLDAVPACPYEFEVTVAADGPAGRLLVFDASSPADDRLLAAVDLPTAAGTARLPFVSDGRTPLRLVFDASGTAGAVRLERLSLRAARYAVPAATRSSVPHDRSVYLGPSRFAGGH